MISISFKSTLLKFTYLLGSFPTNLLLLTGNWTISYWSYSNTFIDFTFLIDSENDSKEDNYFKIHSASDNWLDSNKDYTHNIDSQTLCV